jgi:multidrug efflux pump subunit AcrB
LKQVADIEIAWQPALVLRRDRLRTVTVKSDITHDVTAIAIAREIDKWLQAESESWGVDAKYELGGEMESSVKANESIVAKLPFAMLIIVLLLVDGIHDVSGRDIACGNRH